MYKVFSHYANYPY